MIYKGAPVLVLAVRFCESTLKSKRKKPNFSFASNVLVCLFCYPWLGTNWRLQCRVLRFVTISSITLRKRINASSLKNANLLINLEYTFCLKFRSQWLLTLNETSGMIYREEILVLLMCVALRYANQWFKCEKLL